MTTTPMTSRELRRKARRRRSLVRTIAGAALAVLAVLVVANAFFSVYSTQMAYYFVRMLGLLTVLPLYLTYEAIALVAGLIGTIIAFRQRQWGWLLLILVPTVIAAAGSAVLAYVVATGADPHSFAFVGGPAFSLDSWWFPIAWTTILAFPLPPIGTLLFLGSDEGSALTGQTVRGLCNRALVALGALVVPVIFIAVLTLGSPLFLYILVYGLPLVFLSAGATLTAGFLCLLAATVHRQYGWVALATAVTLATATGIGLCFWALPLIFYVVTMPLVSYVSGVPRTLLFALVAAALLVQVAAPFITRRYSRPS